MKSFAAAFCVLLLTGCSHLFYYPSKKMFVDPKTFKLEYEPIEFEVKLNNKEKAEPDRLLAWYFKGKSKKDCPSKPLIVFLHGNAENISTHFFQLAWVTEIGADLLIFDYPGYGQSMGEATRENIQRATVQVLDEVLGATQPPFKDKRVVLYGQSLGGTILLGALPKLKSLTNVKHIVIESSFASYQRIARRKLANFWLSWPFQWLPYVAVSDRYSIDDSYAALKLPPLTFIHGEQDQVVSLLEGQELFALLPEPKEFWSVPKAGHLHPMHPSFGLHERLQPKFCAN